MPMWLLVLLVVVIAASMWLSQRRRQKAHPGSTFGDTPDKSSWPSSTDPWHPDH